MSRSSQLIYASASATSLASEIPPPANRAVRDDSAIRLEIQNPPSSAPTLARKKLPSADSSPLFRGVDFPSTPTTAQNPIYSSAHLSGVGARTTESPDSLLLS